MRLPPQSVSRANSRPRSSSTGEASLRTALACAVFVAVLFAAPALACPNCAVGIQARTEVWNGDFWFNLLVAVMPFLVIAAVCTYVEQRDTKQHSRCHSSRARSARSS